MYSSPSESVKVARQAFPYTQTLVSASQKEFGGLQILRRGEGRHFLLSVTTVGTRQSSLRLPALFYLSKTRSINVDTYWEQSPTAFPSHAIHKPEIGEGCTWMSTFSRCGWSKSTAAG